MALMQSWRELLAKEAFAGSGQEHIGVSEQGILPRHASISVSCSNNQCLSYSSLSQKPFYKVK